MMHPAFHPPWRRPRGFALVVTVSLMVLLSLLAIGLLGLSVVSLRSSGHHQALAEARANARMALTMALGQLQVELGPDQRINAPADLLDDTLDARRSTWVGVWDSWEASEKDRPEPAFRRWLVSGGASGLSDELYPASAVDLISLENRETGPLASAPRVITENGGFAYAVFDENSKARLGEPFDPAEERLGPHLSRLQSSPAGHDALNGWEDLVRDDPQLERLFTQRSSEMVAQVAEASPARRSFSVWSEGLLTDVRNGGLRRDLSLKLALPDRSRGAGEAFYSVARRDGINMRELRAFQNLPGRLKSRTSHGHPDRAPLNSSIPILEGEGNESRAATDEAFAYLRPVVLRASWLISAMTREVRSGRDTVYKLYIVLEPIVTLWNPYDVHLAMLPGGHLTVRCWGLPYDFDVSAGGRSKRVFFNTLFGSNNVSMEIGQRTPVVMRPGEVLIYSTGQDANAPTTNPGPRFEGKLGWSGTGGFAVDTGLETTGRDGKISIAMDRSTSRGATGWGLIEFLSYVGTDSNNNYWNGGLMIDRSGAGSELTAEMFPDNMFQEMPERAFDNGRALLNTPEPIAIFSMMARTEDEGAFKTRYLSRLNPAAGGFDHQSTDTNTLVSLPYEPVLVPLSGGLDRIFDYFNGKGFFGASYRTDAGGQSHLITHSIPREAPISLGAFQHAHANGVEKWTFTGPNSGNFHDRILQPSINHAIGNSFAPPCIAPDQTQGSFNGQPAADHSWLINDALWDSWFVSSIADRQEDHLAEKERGTARELFSRFAGIDGDSINLPNRDYLYAGSDPEAERDNLFSGTRPQNDADSRLAALLRVRGAFNINSTDVAAWEAQFRSTSGNHLPVFSPSSPGEGWEEGATPFANLAAPCGPAVETGDLDDPTTTGQWTGYRDLEETETRALAEAMVEEVRKRGPFLSLADFVNRRLSTDTELASRGALQAALDRTVNSTLESGGRAAGDAPRGSAFPGAENGSMTTHVPGHVKQGDILTTIGTRLTPRSDTFTIRTYGEARDEAGRLLAIARCEAVVQRDAQWLDPSDPPEAATTALSQAVNQRFGRRFTIVSFRWLSESEA